MFHKMIMIKIIEQIPRFLILYELIFILKISY